MGLMTSTNAGPSPRQKADGPSVLRTCWIVWRKLSFLTGWASLPRVTDDEEASSRRETRTVWRVLITQIGLEMTVVAEPLEPVSGSQPSFSFPAQSKQQELTRDGACQHALERAQGTTRGNHGALRLGGLRRQAPLGAQNDVPALLEKVVVDTVPMHAFKCQHFIVTSVLRSRVSTTHKFVTPTPMRDELRPAYRPVMPSC